MNFKVAVIDNSKFSVFKSPQTGQYEGLSGPEYELLQILAESLHFNYELLVAKDSAWGVPLANGNWSGIVGMVHRNEADIAINSIDMNVQRSEVVDFSFPYFIYGVVFAMKKADTVMKDFFLLQSFQTSVWICLIVCFVICSILLASLNVKKGFVRPTLRNVRRAAEILGGYREFKRDYDNIWARMFFVFVSLSLRILVLSFVAVILSFLTAPDMKPPFENVETLARASRDGRAKVSVVKNSARETVLMHAKNGTFRDLSVNLRNNPESFIQADNKLANVLENGYVVLYSKQSIAIDAYETGFHGELFVSDELLQTNFAGIGFKKGFCCISDFNHVILVLYQAGIYNKLVKDYEDRSSSKAGSLKIQTNEENLKRISLQALNGLFLTYGSLLIFCVVVFFLEICSRKWWNIILCYIRI